MNVSHLSKCQSVDACPCVTQHSQTSTSLKHAKKSSNPTLLPSLPRSLPKNLDLVLLSWRNRGSSPLLLHVGYSFLFALVSSQTPPPSSSSLFPPPSLLRTASRGDGRRTARHAAAAAATPSVFYPLVFLLGATSAPTAWIFLRP